MEEKETTNPESQPTNIPPSNPPPAATEQDSALLKPKSKKSEDEDFDSKRKPSKGFENQPAHYSRPIQQTNPSAAYSSQFYTQLQANSYGYNRPQGMIPNAQFSAYIHEFLKKGGELPKSISQQQLSTSNSLVSWFQETNRQPQPQPQSQSPYVQSPSIVSKSPSIGTTNVIPTSSPGVSSAVSPNSYGLPSLATQSMNPQGPQQFLQQQPQSPQLQQQQHASMMMASQRYSMGQTAMSGTPQNYLISSSMKPLAPSLIPSASSGMMKSNVVNPSLMTTPSNPMTSSPSKQFQQQQQSFASPAYNVVANNSQPNFSSFNGNPHAVQLPKQITSKPAELPLDPKLFSPSIKSETSSPGIATPSNGNSETTAASPPSPLLVTTNNNPLSPSINLSTLQSQSTTNRTQSNPSVTSHSQIPKGMPTNTTSSGQTSSFLYNSPRPMTRTPTPAFLPQSSPGSAPGPGMFPTSTTNININPALISPMGSSASSNYNLPPFSFPKTPNYFGYPVSQQQQQQQHQQTPTKGMPTLSGNLTPNSNIALTGPRIGNLPGTSSSAVTTPSSSSSSASAAYRSSPTAMWPQNRPSSFQSVSTSALNLQTTSSPYPQPMYPSTLINSSVSSMMVNKKKRPSKKKKDEFDSFSEEDSDSPEEESSQRRALFNIVRKCQLYSDQIRSIIVKWKEKYTKGPSSTQTSMLGTVGPSQPQQVSEEPQLEIIQPSNLKHTLRSYQLVGLNWLYLLFKQKINGILADEMGLGKTIQTIALFSLLKQRNEAQQPHLVIAPSTALENWVREFKEWAPDLKVALYHGAAKDRQQLRTQLLPSEDGVAPFDVLVTSYNICISKADRVPFFKRFDFAYIVLDEAHSIKNVGSARYQNLLKLAFKAKYRLLLTGTPLQNNINELWALLNFLMPDIFGTTEDFKTLVWPEDDEPDSANKNSKEISRLQKILDPFYLRRMKSEVLTKLPPKTEEIVWCKMTSTQQQLYKKIFQKSKSEYAKTHSQQLSTESSSIPGSGSASGPSLPLEQSKDHPVSPAIKSEVSEGKQEQPPPPPPPTTTSAEERDLNVILMRLRKAANNSLLFRIFYDDSKLAEIEIALRKFQAEEASKKLIKSESAQSEMIVDHVPSVDLKPSTTTTTTTVDNDVNVVSIPTPAIHDNPSEPTLPLVTGSCSIPMETTTTSTTQSTNVNPIIVDHSSKESTVLPTPLPLPPTATTTTPLVVTSSPAAVTQQSTLVPSTTEPKVAKDEATMENGGNFSESDTEDECSICFQFAGVLLCCDGACKRSFHVSCLGLEKEPDAETWICPDCTSNIPVVSKKNNSYYSQFMNIYKAVVHFKDKRMRQIAFTFFYLPSKDDYPDYYQIISKPVSLSQIRGRLPSSPEEFRDTFLRMFDNARTYNIPSSQIFKDATLLEKVFAEEFKKHFPQISLPVKLTRNITPKPLSRKSTPKKLTSTADSEDEEDSDSDSVKPKRRKKDARKPPESDESDTDSKSARRRTPQRRASLRIQKQRKHSDSDENDSSDEEISGETDSTTTTTTTTTTATSKRVGLSPELQICKQLLQDVMEQNEATPFNKPPTWEVSDQTIKDILNLKIIKKKMTDGKYVSSVEFVMDVRSVFNNCVTSTSSSAAVVTKSAQALWSYFKKECKKNGIGVADAILKPQPKGIDVTGIMENLKIYSDLEVHRFCESYSCLQSFCLPDELIFESSGKLIQLRQTLGQMYANQNRIVMFSQFTQVLNILEIFLSRLNYKFLRLDGTTPVLERQPMIDEFNTNREIFVFLLSTRAGGIGINLTSADIAMFHDIDWNPEMDRQAEARVHRIGQVKPVKILKFLSKDSVDEHILKLAESKKQRNDLVFGAKTGTQSQQQLEEMQTSSGDVDKLSIGQVLSSIFAKEDAQ